MFLNCSRHTPVPLIIYMERTRREAALGQDSGTALFLRWSVWPLGAGEEDAVTFPQLLYIDKKVGHNENMEEEFAGSMAQTSGEGTKLTR